MFNPSACRFIAILLTASSPLLLPLPARAGGLDTIAAYSGSWSSHIVHYKTRYSKPRTENTHLRNECWRNGNYFACDQFVDGPSKALVVFTYDATHHVYHTYGIPADGTPANSGTLLITGDTWTFPWRDRDNGKTVYGRVINVFHGRNTIEYRQEFSFDQKHWTVASRGTEHRVTR